MKRNYIIPGIIAGMGAICWGAYRLIGSTVAPDGRLIEPFFLIPFGYIFLAIGFCLFIIIWFWPNVIRRKPKK